MPPEAAELAAMEFGKVGILLEGAGTRAGEGERLKVWMDEVEN